MRLFKGMLFLGAGNHSVRSAKALHKRLDDALDDLGGLQQGPVKPPFTSQAEAECVERLEKLRLDAVSDLVAALCGSEYKVGVGLPYPGPKGDISIEDYLEGKK